MDIFRQHELFEVELDKFIRRLDQFKDIDFKVKLGSILESDVRDYYAAQKFGYLKEGKTS